MTRIGVNALYLIPGGVGGTEIYLRELLPRPRPHRHIERILRLHQLRNSLDQRRRSGSPPGEFSLEAASRPRRLATRAHSVGTDRSTHGSLALPPGCSVQSRIHRSDLRAVPLRDRFSRPPAQAPSRIFPLVRSSLLAPSPVDLRPPLAHPHRRLRSDPRGSRTFLQIRRRAHHRDPSRRRPGIFRAGPFQDRTLHPLRLHPASAQESRSLDPRLCAEASAITN